MGRRVTGTATVLWSAAARSNAAVFIAVQEARSALALPELLAVALLSLPLISCAGEPAGRGEVRRPNVVLYVVDTVRADRLGAYGYEKPTSPRLDAFAQSAILFENAYAQSSWTRPAVASLFTGLLPPAHRTVGRRSVLPEEATTLTEILSANGYEGLGLVRNPNVGAAFGFSQGFARFRSEDRERDETMLDRVRLWLEERQDPERPFFLYLHAIDPHGPYAPAPEFEQMFDAGGAPANYRTVRYLLQLNQGEVQPDPGTAEALSRLYDAEVAQNDRAFGQLLDELEARGLARDTAVIYVSDHGEEFEEHGRWEHGVSLYEEVLRIPFVMRLPGIDPRRIESAAQHVDLVPTLLAYLGIEAPATDGRDLLSAPKRGDDPPDVYAHLDVDNHRSSTVIRGHYKLVLPQSPSQGSGPMLFDLEADRDERENLAPSRPEIVRRMMELLAGRGLAGEVEPAVELEDDQIDEDLRRRLRALGYVD